MAKHRNFNVICSLVPFIYSCAPKIESVERSWQRAELLAVQIDKERELVGSVDSRKLALKAVNASRELRNHWDIQLTPWLNNLLINCGIKECGLCYHWAESLAEAVEKSVPGDMRITFIEKNAGMLFEHHILSLHSSSKSWTTGIALDGWRGAGNLMFYSLEDDTKAFNWRFEDRDLHLAVDERSFTY